MHAEVIYTTVHSNLKLIHQWIDSVIKDNLNHYNQTIFNLDALMFNKFIKFEHNIIYKMAPRYPFLSVLSTHVTRLTFPAHPYIAVINSNVM